jgi:hypothetical protein
MFPTWKTVLRMLSIPLSKAMLVFSNYTSVPTDMYIDTVIHFLIDMINLCSGACRWMVGIYADADEYLFLFWYSQNASEMIDLFQVESDYDYIMKVH